jgi:hypothetical protein
MRSYITGHKVAQLVLIFAVAVAALSRGTRAQTVMPSPKFQGLDNSGRICGGCLLNVYISGTTTRAVTYSDSALATPNTNPVVLDSAGRATVYLTSGSSYKFILTTAAGSTLWTQDTVTATPTGSQNVVITGLAAATLTSGECAFLSDGSGGKTPGSWYACDSTNTYSSTTPVVGLSQGAITSGTTGSIQLAGRITGLTSLTVGAAYYVTTGGALTTTAPTNARLVGAADSTTSLILTANPSTAAPGGNFQTGDLKLTIAATCGTGFTDVSASFNGFYPLIASANIGSTIGTALTALENRPAGQHTHTATSTVTDPGHGHRWNTDHSGVGGGPGVFGLSGAGSLESGYIENSPTGIAVATTTANPAGSVAGTNAPYKIFRACQKS